MAKIIPYISNSQGNTTGVGVGQLNSPGASTSSNSYALNSRYISPEGIGQGTRPLPAVNIKSPRVNLRSERAISDIMTLNDIVNKLNKSLNLPDEDLNSYAKIVNHDIKYYNRFKIANPNTKLQKGFPHVFFVSPMCNILLSNGQLNKQFADVDLYGHILKTSPKVLQEISRFNSKVTDFSMLLSNYAKSFSLSDEYIGTDTYGRTYTGYKISYGKNDIESKTSGSFDVTFSDTRNLDIYKLNRAWVEYISGVYRGQYSPRNEDILNKVLDYAGALYYILTAEDGETIIFWTKYYGVFPSTIPSTQYSWGSGNTVTDTDLSVTYQYSFKEDYDPQSLVEFNMNARAGNVKSYLPIYDKNLGTIGTTYAKRPYIELDKSSNGYVYKLRFEG